MQNYIAELVAEIKAKNPAEPEFHQAVHEVVQSLALILERQPEFRKAKIIERMVEPERVVMFRVPWVDDAGELIPLGVERAEKEMERAEQEKARAETEKTRADALAAKLRALGVDPESV